MLIRPQRHRVSSSRLSVLLIAALTVVPVAVFFHSGCESAAVGEANGSSDSPAISADGRFVAFSSEANNLVAGDNNDKQDVFVKDAATGRTIMVSTNVNGDEGNGDSSQPAISADGSLVAFSSDASNLVSGDDNTCTGGGASWNCADIFVKNINTGSIERVSTSSEGLQGDWFSESPSISSDGRYVAFASYASNLVSGDSGACDAGNGPRNCADIFVKDRETGLTARISITPEGVEGDGDSTAPAISGNGRYVAFTSKADSLAVDDNNQASDVFIANLDTGAISRISENSESAGGNGFSYQPAISDDGRYIAFTSRASNFTAGDTGMCLESGAIVNCTDVYLLDFTTGVFTRVSKASGGIEPDGSSGAPSISADGRVIAFASYAGNLVDTDNVSCNDVEGSVSCSDIFVSKLLLGTISLASANSGGAQGDWNSSSPAVSADGQFVAFVSFAANLVKGDTDACTDGETSWNCADVFRKNLTNGEITRVSTIDGTG
jgi:Tol biopolymer transport system component